MGRRKTNEAAQAGLRKAHTNAASASEEKVTSVLPPAAEPSESSQLQEMEVDTTRAEAEPANGRADEAGTSRAGQPGAADLTSADYYFDSYSHFGIHEEMLKDSVRTKTYQNAIYNNAFLFRDKIVLDVGAGTGILSLFAAKAGAKHVYAIECSAIADSAREIIKANNYDNVITVIKGKVEELDLPVPQVDIIISEWMGYFLLYESMLDTVLFARDKWLAPDGIMMPDKASLYLTAIEDSEYKQEKIHFWDSVYGFDMSCVKKQAMLEPLVDTVDAEQIVTNTYHVKTMDIKKMSKAETSFTVPFRLQATRNDYIHALVAHFDVSFTQCHKPLSFSTGPTKRPTHWKQTVLYLENVIAICEKEFLTGSLSCKPNAKNNRDLDIVVSYEYAGVREKLSGTQHYRMR